jgi:uncharacterized membrane protein
MNLYIRIFLVAAVSTGFYAALRGGLGQGVIHGVVLGGIMTLIMAIVQRFAPQDGIHPTRTIDLPLAYNHAFDSSLAAIGTALNGKVLAQDRLSGLIEARTGLTWKSFGEDVLVTIRELDENHTQIRITAYLTTHNA